MTNPLDYIHKQEAQNKLISGLPNQLYAPDTLINYPWVFIKFLVLILKNNKIMFTNYRCFINNIYEFFDIW